MSHDFEVVEYPLTETSALALTVATNGVTGVMGVLTSHKNPDGTEYHLGEELVKKIFGSVDLTDVEIDEVHFSNAVKEHAEMIEKLTHNQGFMLEVGSVAESWCEQYHRLTFLEDLTQLKSSLIFGKATNGWVSIVDR